MNGEPDFLERARYDDLVSDIIARVRRVTPGIPDSVVERIDQEIRSEWGGMTIRVRRISAVERERIRDLVARGVSARTARYKVRGR